jgi:pilus assembly protein CpaB
MNRNRWLLVGVICLVMSIFLAYWIFKALGASKVATKPIVIASKHVLPGALLSSENLTTLDYPIYHPISGSFDSIKKVDKRVAMVELFPNDIVLNDKLVEQGAIGGLTASIDQDKRAVSVKVDSVIGVAGFVLPGTYVDVIVTGQPGSSDELVSKIIVENVKVLTADKNLERDPEGKAKESKVVTLLVSPEQANKIALASTNGRIQLALRNSKDEHINNPPPITQKQLYTQEQLPVIRARGTGTGTKAAVKRLPPPPQGPIEVEVRLGDAVKNSKVEVEQQ